MYRALYDYKSSLGDYLSFERGDRFTLLEDAISTETQSANNHKDWLLAQNGIGQIGYVPHNYINKYSVLSTDVIKFIDGSIEAIHLQASETGGVISQYNRETLQKLLQHRNLFLESIQNESAAVVKRTSKRQAPEPPVSSDGNPRRSSSRKSAPPPPPCRDSSLGIKSTACNSTNDDSGSWEIVTKPREDEATISSSLEVASSPDIKELSMSLETSPVCKSPTKKSSVHIPSNIGSELIEEIRINTGLSFNKSKVALETVLGYVGFKIPELSSAMDEIFQTSQGVKQSTGDLASRDAQRLEVIFSELAACKDDSQQRSWALHEDESIITEYLEELISILENAKKSISIKMISHENYECVHNLVQYYQMETRFRIRLLLLQSFGALCSLDKRVITTLLFSVLPLELCQDILNKSNELQLLSYVTLVLSMMFSTGEMVPSNLHDHLNEKFIEHLFDLIENPPTADHEDEVTDSLVTLILAYNLHMDPPPSNIVMTFLSQKGTVKVFTEKVMLLFNRGDDPVCMFEHKPKADNSVVKFFQDLYASPETANLLYTNDAMVLIDILIQQVTDLPAGDSTRSAFLILMNLLVKNSDYEEYRHRSQEISELLKCVKSEETNNPLDRQIVNELLQNYSHIFA